MTDNAKSHTDTLIEIGQFLTDVVTAAGLLSYGRTDKKLATRITQQADDLRKQIHLLRASRVAQPAAAPAGVITETPRAYPDDLSDTLRHVLGFPNFRCAPYAHLMRDSGADIDSRSEDEQAHVLHWLVKLVLDHGDRWADVAELDLNAMRTKARAMQDGEVSQ
ncbi:hypothetical protein [Burkholderia glumae]|uniref:hypothetical protein n=1 Tax=Burkholderia glumae TaxID=337 RepID=UPI002036E6B8|nr:hypothetical protein [Burkholderia glumae]MCM2490847.1 hypothetical protein [Burkholderia glumae]